MDRFLQNFNNFECIKFGHLATILTGVVIFTALEIPEWFILITGAPIPWLGHWFPYALPFLVSILVFSVSSMRKIGRYHIGVDFPVAVLTIFILVICITSFGHWWNSAIEYKDWLFLVFLWIYLFFLTIKAISSLTAEPRANVVVWSKVWIFLAVILQFLFADLLSDGRGEGLYFFVDSQLFDSVVIAYLGVLGLALIFFEKGSESRKLKLFQFFVLAPLLMYVIFSQRLAGPFLLAMMVIAFRAIIIFYRINRASIFYFAILLFLGGTLIVIPYLEITLKGLNSGFFLFDEIGKVHGESVSGFISLEAIRHQLMLFLEYPLFGAGMAKASEVRVLGHGMHSSLLYILVSFGILGFSLMVLFFASLTIENLRAGSVENLIYLFILLGHGLLVSEPVWWWSILIYLLLQKNQNNHIKEAKGVS